MQQQKTKTKTNTDAKAELMQRAENIRAEIARCDESINQSFMKMAPLITEVWKQEYFRLWGYPDQGGFEMYCKDELSISLRKARYLIKIWTKLEEFDVDEKVATKVGWSKLKEIVSIADADDIDEWIKFALTHTVKQIKEKIKQIKEAKNPGLPGVDSPEGRTKLQLPTTTTEKEHIMSGIEEAKRLIGVDNNTSALEYIVQEWQIINGDGPRSIENDLTFIADKYNIKNPDIAKVIEVLAGKKQFTRKTSNQPRQPEPQPVVKEEKKDPEIKSEVRDPEPIPEPEPEQQEQEHSQLFNNTAPEKVGEYDNIDSEEGFFADEEYEEEDEDVFIDPRDMTESQIRVYIMDQDIPVDENEDIEFLRKIIEMHQADPKGFKKHMNKKNKRKEKLEKEVENKELEEQRREEADSVLNDFITQYEKGNTVNPNPNSLGKGVGDDVDVDTLLGF